MFDTDKNEKIYNTFLDFKKTFFEKGVSFFDESVYLFDNDDVFVEYENRILKNYDGSKGINSREKYKKQLSNASKKFRHFFANIIWLRNFPIHQTSKKDSTKKNEIKTYLDQYYNKDSVDKVMKYSGIASYGMLAQSIYYDVNFIYFFTKKFALSNKNPHEIIDGIDLYSLMKEHTTEEINNIQLVPSRQILHYLFDPDYYEPIVDVSCKRNIVSHFLGSYDDTTLDDDLYSIRKETFGFEKSLWTEICEQKISQKIAQIVETSYSDKYKISLSQSNIYNEEELLSREQKKITNGTHAEELVYEDIRKNVNTTVLISGIGKMLTLKPGEYTSLLSNVDEFIYYTKYYDTFAPFDLISTRGQEIIFIEVKSTQSNKIYFSKREIEFAYHNIENYQVKVVKDNEIYDIDIMDTILEVFDTMSETGPFWNIENIKFELVF